MSLKHDEHQPVHAAMAYHLEQDSLSTSAHNIQYQNQNEATATEPSVKQAYLIAGLDPSPGMPGSGRGAVASKALLASVPSGVACVGLPALAAAAPLGTAARGALEAGLCHA